MCVFDTHSCSGYRLCIYSRESLQFNYLQQKHKDIITLCYRFFLHDWAHWHLGSTSIRMNVTGEVESKAVSLLCLGGWGWVEDWMDRWMQPVMQARRSSREQTIGSEFIWGIREIRFVLCFVVFYDADRPRGPRWTQACGRRALLQYVASTSTWYCFNLSSALNTSICSWTYGSFSQAERWAFHMIQVKNHVCLESCVKLLLIGPIVSSFLSTTELVSGKVSMAHKVTITFTGKVEKKNCHYPLRKVFLFGNRNDSNIFCPVQLKTNCSLSTFLNISD